MHYEKIRNWAALIFLMLFGVFYSPSIQAEELKGFDLQVKIWAEECREDVISCFEELVRTKKLSNAAVFDSFYVPIPNSFPEKFHTQYDKYTDLMLQKALDGYLRRSTRIEYFIISDINGYVPTHNSKYSQPSSGVRELDEKQCRNKTMHNDRTGLKAARNTEPYLLQYHERDTGEKIYDLSVPIFFNGQHWGSVRVGYN